MQPGAARGSLTRAVLVAAALVGGTLAAAAGVTSARVLPTDTDPAIAPEFNSPQTFFVNRGIVVDHTPGLPADRHELLVFLPGTYGTGTGAGAFCSLAAELGYHAISLSYPTGTAAAQVCDYDEDPRSFELFRLALIQGGTSPHITVARPECVESRLVKFIQWLDHHRPLERWGQFLDGDAVAWRRVAVSGQSQGGGHAALIAIKHEVARVICTGAPKDYSQALGAPAAWYDEPSATPKARFFTFNHVHDHQGCSPREQVQNMRALGLAALGGPVDAAISAPPYSHTRILVTTFPSTTESKAAQGSVIANKYAARWRDAWTYMLTEPTEPTGTAGGTGAAATAGPAGPAGSARLVGPAGPAGSTRPAVSTGPAAPSPDRP